MRKIIFRGKDKTNNKWVVGSGIIVDTNSTIIYRKNIEGLYFENVIPETVGQYTGLTDKNGTKIFEGDIVKLLTLYDTEVGVVGWSEIYFRFKIAFSDGLSDGLDVTDKFEVIGNIHDNPELLGGAE